MDLIMILVFSVLCVIYLLIGFMSENTNRKLDNYFLSVIYALIVIMLMLLNK